MAQDGSSHFRIASGRVRIAFALRPGAAPNADLGALLGPTWPTRRLKQPILIHFFAILGFFSPSWLLLGASWQCLKPSLRRLGAILAESGQILPQSLNFDAKLELAIIENHCFLHWFLKIFFIRQCIQMYIDFWSELGRIFDHLGQFWGRLGVILGHPGVILGPLGVILGPSWAILASFWAILGISWTFLGLSWTILGPSWDYLGPSWAILSLPEGTSPHRKAQ